MRFEELSLQGPEDSLELRFHPQLTVLAGLGPAERQALADGVVTALAGGTEISELTYRDSTDDLVTIVGRDGRVAARRADGTPVAEPLGSIAPDRRALRDLVLLSPDDLGVQRRPNRADEPPELREARDTLDELTLELEAAQAEYARAAELRTTLAQLEKDLVAAREGAARREYAKVLAQLERVRAEAAALETDENGIEADQTLIAKADGVRALARRWAEAVARVAQLREQLPEIRLDADERDRLAAIPEAPPAGLEEQVDALAAAATERDLLDQRLQDLAVAQLPTPSDPLVAELGLLDQGALWRAAHRLERAEETMQRVRLSAGGLDLGGPDSTDLGPAPSVVAEIESAHAELEEAERAQESAKVRGLAGAGIGVTAGVLGLAASPVLLPAGLVGAAVAAGAGLMRPKARRAKAERAEQEALQKADATSYLGFHIRRVEASVDPTLRDQVDNATDELRDSQVAWAQVAGPSAELTATVALRDEIQAYNDALRDLGSTAQEMEHLRGELANQAIPAWRAAREALAATCAPYQVDDEELDEARLPLIVDHRCRLGVSARAEIELVHAEFNETRAAGDLDRQLLELGFDAGELDARVGALEWAVTRAEEREDARRRARPRAEVDADMAALSDAAAALRRPEWGNVTAEEAEALDVDALERQQAECTSELATVQQDADLDRLADRHAAVERRVLALEARLGNAANGDPGALADLQQHLLARLTTAAQAAPGGEPVPVILDEAFQRVPADRTWDLLDLVFRLSEKHQLIYMTDDAFVAAWARQRALDGSIMLLEAEPDVEMDTVDLDIEAQPV